MDDSKKGEGNMNRTKRKWVGLLTILGFFFILIHPLSAEEYPTKPIYFVTPWGAGGALDAVMRSYANVVKKSLGQPVIAENKTGGGGVVGTVYVLTKPPDGYTIGITSLPPTLVSYHMGTLDYHPVDDFTYIIRVCGYFFGICVRADSPWKTVQEFIQYCKANPGKVSYSSSGVGSTGHIIMEEFAFLAGIEVVHVPYKGGDTSTALLGGHVEALSDAAWAPYVEAGKFRLLATFGSQRFPRYPQVPTAKELGYDMVRPSPIQIYGPKGLTKNIVNKLHDAFKNSMDDPGVQAALNRFNMPNLYLNSEDCEKAVRQDLESFGKLVQKLGLQKKK
jgi:tripartite-type tricarboxylate transporter receptor subunit TctC